MFKKKHFIFGEILQISQVALNSFIQILYSQDLISRAGKDTFMDDRHLIKGVFDRCPFANRHFLFSPVRFKQMKFLKVYFFPFYYLINTDTIIYK